MVFAITRDSWPAYWFNSFYTNDPPYAISLRARLWQLLCSPLFLFVAVCIACDHYPSYADHLL